MFDCLITTDNYDKGAFTNDVITLGGVGRFEKYDGGGSVGLRMTSIF